MNIDYEVKVEKAILKNEILDIMNEKGLSFENNTVDEIYDKVLIDDIFEYYKDNINEIFSRLCDIPNFSYQITRYKKINVFSYAELLLKKCYEYALEEMSVKGW